MAIIKRSYNHEKDFLKVREFLKDNYSLESPPFNWCWVRWDTMHFHRKTGDVSDHFDRIGIWEEGGKIVAVAHFEHIIGFVYFETDQDHSYLKKDMLDYAQENLSLRLGNGRKVLKIYINEFDKEFEKIASEGGFTKSTLESEPVSIMDITPGKLKYLLTKGFTICSLEEENDFEKMNTLMHRSFNHLEEPTKQQVELRKENQKAPGFNKDTTIVALDPEGRYASYCGSWYDDKNKLAVIEPLATDPNYRMMGLGRAVVYEALRRNYELGARKALVGSSQDFYLKIGFKKYFTRYCWIKYFRLTE